MEWGVGSVHVYMCISTHYRKHDTWSLFIIMSSPRHKRVISNLGALFLLQLVHLNGNLEQESRSTFLLYPLKSDNFTCLRPEYQGKILRDVKGCAFNQIMKSMSYFFFFKLPPHFFVSSSTQPSNLDLISKRSIYLVTLHISSSFWDSSCGYTPPCSAIIQAFSFTLQQIM